MTDTPDPTRMAARLMAARDRFFDAPSYETWYELRAVIEAMKPPRLTGPLQYDERYEIRQGDVERAMYSIGQDIGERLPEGWGFALFLMDYGENGATFYMSSVQRADVMNAIEEWLRREKRKPSPNMAPKS